MERFKTKEVRIGKIKIGGFNPIAVQSMTNTDTKDLKATVEQIQKLKAFGCDIVRIAVPDEESALNIKRIKEEVDIPLVADIHFNYKLALYAIEQGIDKIRINPGNLSKENLKTIVREAKDKGIPIRVGVNSGSIEREFLEKHKGNLKEAIIESACNTIKFIEDLGFSDLVISLKSSNVPLTIDCYREIIRFFNYPLHIGITEAGSIWSGTIKSSIGIGTLLYLGIGDTIRVSLTGDPVEEVKTAIEILKALGLRKSGIEIISCPTCGRCTADLIKIVREVEEKLLQVKKELKVAVMGCAVNGPGEAREADIGVAVLDRNFAVLFKKGKLVKKIPVENLVTELLKEVSKETGEHIV